MVWRLPDREIGAQPDPVGLELPPEYITRNSGTTSFLIHNSYIRVEIYVATYVSVMYKPSIDCKLSSSDFDAIEELHSGLGALKLPPPQPTSHEYGAYLRQQRQQREACKPLIYYIYM